ncbi:hypothetical protein J0H58_37265 [bacterium]|nr:hypothetical protein [bacterium]
MNRTECYFLREQHRRIARDANRAAIDASRDPNSTFLLVTAVCLGAVLAGALAIQGVGRAV